MHIIEKYGKMTGKDAERIFLADLSKNIICISDLKLL